MCVDHFWVTLGHVRCHSFIVFSHIVLTVGTCVVMSGSLFGNAESLFGNVGGTLGNVGIIFFHLI